MVSETFTNFENNIGAGTASYGTVTETFTNIENLRGSDNDDSLRGDGNINVIEGGAGDDTLIWSGGEDVLDGGEGFDTVDYSTSAVPVIVELDENGDGTATRETGLEIEGISPSELITLGNGALSAIHLHNAPAGQNGPVLQDIIVDAGGNVEGNSGFEVSVDMAEVADDGAFIAAADAGNLYFNVHTSDFPGGEIRGQLDTVVSDETVDGLRTLVLSASLDGAEC